MDRDAEQEIIRRAYAKQIMAACGVSDRRIEAAFSLSQARRFSWARPLANRALGPRLCPDPKPEPRIPL